MHESKTSDGRAECHYHYGIEVAKRTSELAILAHRVNFLKCKKISKNNYKNPSDAFLLVYYLCQEKYNNQEKDSSYSETDFNFGVFI
jgi:hypothetical protein